ncbi:MAG: hypothetical protein QM757_08245 [Paludibaculum sp.]
MKGPFLFLLPATLLAQAPKGLGCGMILEGQPVAFRLEFAGALRARDPGGEKREYGRAPAGFAEGSLELKWDYFDSVLKASMMWKGSYVRRVAPVLFRFYRVSL